MITINNVIIESFRDEQTLGYLIKVLGEDLIIETIKGFNGGTRYYVSNIAKKHKVDIPPHIYAEVADRAIALKHIADLKLLFDSAS